MLIDKKFIVNTRTHLVGICDVCGSEFDKDISYANSMKYCSNECSGKARTQKALKSFTCENCMNIFQRPNSYGKNRFCSQHCSRQFQANQNRKWLTCKYCNKELITTNNIYCSKKCRELQKTKKFVDLKTKFLKRPKNDYKKYLDERGRYTNCVICEKKLDKPYAQKLFCGRVCRIVGTNLGIRYTPIFVDKECLSCKKIFQEKIGETDSHKKKYCSHACYLKVNKKAGKKFVSLLDEEAVVFHSTWELRFAAACYKHNLLWRRYDGDPIHTEVGDYYPDFIVGNNDNIVEIKGYIDENAVIKTEKAREIFGDKYYLLLEEQLMHFEETGELINSII